MGYVVCEVGVGEVGRFETFYTACRATIGNANRYVIEAGKGGRRARAARCAAFYCPERLRVVPMFGATGVEREELEGWF